jgi:peptide/nickel transport system permease protein
MRNNKADSIKGTTTASKKKKKSGSILQRLFSKKGPLVGMIIIVILVMVSVLAPVICKYSPSQISIRLRNALPSWEHPCGCDDLGRDILTRLLYGGRTSISIGVLATAIGTLIGIIIGILAGYFGGMIDNLLMRFLDVFQSLPQILLAIIISTVLGPGFLMTVFALSISSMPGIARMMRASILTVRENEYIEAAIAIKCSTSRIIFKHILPNSIAPVLVNISNSISHAVLTSSGLSFIGLGIRPPTAEWGAMLAAGRNYIRTFPHMVIFPGIIIGIFVLVFNLFTDGLRDVLDPKLKR